jgi:hypothetical protein
MPIEIAEMDAKPKDYEILAVVRTNYRSGSRYDISVRFNWKIAAAADKFQCYTATVTIPWDRATETVADLKAKAKAAFDALKAADTNEADLIFALARFNM